MGIRVERQKEKITLIAILLAGSCSLTYYFHGVLQTGILFTHFFYAPIILASLWWKRKGLAVAIFLAVFLIFSHHFFLRDYVTTANDYLRSLMFVVIAFVVALLSERIAKAQERAAHLNAVLRAIRNVNQLIAREKEQDKLLEGACKSLIETRGFYNAWIALFDESRRLVATAQAGLGKHFLPMVERLKSGELPACGRKAMFQSEVLVTKDPHSTCLDCPLSDRYRGRGSMAVRLEYMGKVYGILSMSVPADLTDDEEEIELVDEVARDIAFALHAIELEERHKRAEEELREYYDHLEQLVAERTAELTKVNEQLEQDISNRKRVEEALRESEERYKGMFNYTKNGVAIYKAINDGEDFIFVDFNRSGEKIDNVSRDELIGKRVAEMFPGVKEFGLFEVLQRVWATAKPEHHPVSMYKDERIVGWRDNFVYKLPSGEIVAVYSDETERKQAEEGLNTSLREKEVLLKEVHYRVKNNLQIISSLLDLSRRRTENQEAVYLLSDAQAKVHTMALIHAQLYQSDRFDRIDMGRHIQELLNFLAAIYATKSRFVTYLVKPSDVFLELTQALPCALVLNELISNAFKHAFKEGQKGRIEVSIQRTADDTIVIRAKDDGKGIPEEIDIDKTDTLGLKLARNLIQSQLGGKIRVEGNGGTEIVIEFNISKEEREYA